jgi:hypothetical protein
MNGPHLMARGYFIDEPLLKPKTLRHRFQRWSDDPSCASGAGLWNRISLYQGSVVNAVDCQGNKVNVYAWTGTADDVVKPNWRELFSDVRTLLTPKSYRQAAPPPNRNICNLHVCYRCKWPSVVQRTEGPQNWSSIGSLPVSSMYRLLRNSSKGV